MAGLLGTILICLIAEAALVSCRFELIINDVVEYYGKTAWISILGCPKSDVKIMAKYLLGKNHRVDIVPMDLDRFAPAPYAGHGFFLLNFNCSSSNRILIEANKKKLFASPFRWIIYDNSGNLNGLVVEHFSGIDILVDSDVTLIETLPNGYKLVKVFKRHVESDIVEEYFGHWTLMNQSLVTTGNFEKSTARRRKNLQGTVLRTCMVITRNDSLNHLTDKRDRHIDSIAKVNYVLVEHLANVVNASLSYSIKSTWGYKDNQSNWSGMIGELTRQEADIGGTALFLTADRVDIIDYIAMTTPTKSKFIFRQPKLSYVTNVFFLPFDMLVWISTFALFVITSVVLFIIVKWDGNKRQYLEDRSEGIEEVQYSLSDSIFIAFGALCQQGASQIPYSVAGRITTIFLFLSFMFLYTSYSANIVALLQSSATNIQTLADLLLSRFDVGVDDTVFNHFYFPNATEPVRRALYVEKVAPAGQKAHFFPIEYGIGRMRQGLFAFHVETGAGYKLIGETFHEDEKCGLKEIQFLQVPDPWLAIQKRSSYKKMLKIGLHQIWESGLQGREVGLIYTKKPPCLGHGSTFVSVGLVDCYPAAAVLAAGLIAGIIILILEIYLHHRINFYAKKIRQIRNRREKHNQNEFTTFNNFME